jgi:4-amino-4-deoxy-L-arabinose transferase-like glycosyltransferase
VLVADQALRSRRSAARLVVLAGLAHLAKPYALPLLAVVLPIGVAAQGLRARRDERRRVLAGGALAAAVAAAVAAPWAIALSVVEGRPTVGTAASHDVALVAPGSP